MFRIITESRSQVSLAQSQCTKDEFSEIQKAEIALEASVGYLECNNFTIDIDCKPANATLCAGTVIANPTLDCS